MIIGIAVMLFMANIFQAECMIIFPFLCHIYELWRLPVLLELKNCATIQYDQPDEI